MNLRYSPVYRILRDEGYTHSHSYAIVNYAEEGWGKLNHRNRRDLMKCRKGPAPGVCPGCGLSSCLEMCSISGKYLEKDEDWDYRCKSCVQLIALDKLPGTSRRVLGKKRADASQLLERIILERPALDIVQILRGLLS
jgi:hypothetical protein